MLSALVLLRHAATSNAPTRLDASAAELARTLADFLQLYNPSVLISAPDRACADTLAPLAGRLGLTVTASDDLSGDQPKFPGGGGLAHTAAWFAARAVRALPDPRRTAVVCADGPVLAALLVAVAAQDAHDLSAYDFPVPLDDPLALPPGGGWVMQRDDGRLTDIKALTAR